MRRWSYERQQTASFLLARFAHHHNTEPCGYRGNILTRLHILLVRVHSEAKASTRIYVFGWTAGQTGHETRSSICPREGASRELPPGLLSFKLIIQPILLKTYPLLSPSLNNFEYAQSVIHFEHRRKPSLCDPLEDNQSHRVLLLCRIAEGKAQRTNPNMTIKEISKNHADYEDIEQELAEGQSLLSAVYEEKSPKIIGKIDEPILDVGFRLSYMAEGGANVIFKIEVAGADYLHLLPAPTQRKMQALQGMLLRVRKEVGTPTRSTCEMVEQYEQRVKPLFNPKYLPQQTLIRLPKNITILLRQMLTGAEEQGKRPFKRRGERLVRQSNVPTAGLATEDPENPEDYGILIQDLSPKFCTEYLLEFKPKWLIPSRSAPDNSKRCRTCALRVLRRVDGTPPGRGDSQFCPLDLLSNMTGILRPALRKLWTIDKLEDEELKDRSGKEIDEGILPANPKLHSSASFERSRGDMFETEFRYKVQPLLGMLRGLQKIHCHAGTHEFDTGNDRELSLAMALRDCSILLKVEATKEKIRILDVKLADLDLKLTTCANREKWMGVERRLIEEGWYQGKVASDIVGDEIICRISRSCT